MTQWYRLGARKDYEIAVISDPDIPAAQEGIKAVLLDDWQRFEDSFDFVHYTRDSKPYKEAWYIKKRYYDHPVYKYNVYGLFGREQKVTLAVVFRVIRIGDRNVIRLIDCIGDLTCMGSMSSLLDHVLAEYDAEYVDCYEVGIEDASMQQSGWKKTEGSGNIIPNYFAPFLRENIDIYYFSSDKDIVLFKGDGDQDRPN